LLQKDERSEVYCLNFVEVVDVLQLLQMESLAMCLHS